MNDQLVQFLRALSRLAGWIYTLSWSVSFYPQPLLNWRRKSTHGLIIEYPFLNVVGFTCYTVATVCLAYSPVIRSQYASRHPLDPVPTVRFNDIAFAIHALILVFITYSQFYTSLWHFEVPRHQRTNWPVRTIVTLCATAVAVVSVIMLSQNGLTNQDASRWAWIDVISTIGYIKLVVTFVKYIPQAWFNYKRKSTEGWSIGQILFDVTGGVLSVLQLIIDATIQHNWKDVIHNPIKLGLGNISIFFDLIFIFQHYYLYRGQRDTRPNNKDDTDAARQPLLTDHT